jgi:hypothetical protein
MKLHMYLFIMAMASFASFVSAQTCNSTSEDCGAEEFCTTNNNCTRFSCESFHSLLEVEGALNCTEYSGNLVSLVYSCTAGTCLGESCGFDDAFIGVNNIKPEEASVVEPFNTFCSALHTDNQKFYCYENSDNSNFDSYVSGTTGLDLSCTGEEETLDVDRPNRGNQSEDGLYKVVRYPLNGAFRTELVRTAEFDLGIARTSIAVSLNKGVNPFENFENNEVVGDGSFANNIGTAFAMVASMATAFIFL